MAEYRANLRRAAAFFGQPIRLPGWITLLVCAVSWVPDWKARWDFWTSLSVPPMIANILASPFIGIALFVLGVMYLWHFRGAVHVHHGSLTVQTAPVASVIAQKLRALTPPQTQLLSLIAKYQGQFAANKLVITRDRGGLVFDGDPQRGRDVSIMFDLFGATDQPAQTRFVDLMESMPPEYIRHFPEMRWDSPFVVGLTDAAMIFIHDRLR